MSKAVKLSGPAEKLVAGYARLRHISYDDAHIELFNYFASVQEFFSTPFGQKCQESDEIPESQSEFKSRELEFNFPKFEFKSPKTVEIRIPKPREKKRILTDEQVAAVVKLHNDLIGNYGATDNMVDRIQKFAEKVAEERPGENVLDFISDLIRAVAAKWSRNIPRDIKTALQFGINQKTHVDKFLMRCEMVEGFRNDKNQAAEKMDEPKFTCAACGRRLEMTQAWKTDADGNYTCRECEEKK